MKINYKIYTNQVSLVKTLKLSGACHKEGAARRLIKRGFVHLNGQPVTDKRAYVKEGDVIKLFSKEIIIENTIWYS